MGGVDFGVLAAIRPFRGGETIGRAEVSANGAVIAVLSGDGRYGKVWVVVRMRMCSSR